MRKTLLIALIGACAAPASAVAPAVTIDVTPRTVIYGGGVRAFGSVSEPIGHQAVIVLVQRHGARSFAPVAATALSARGRWRFQLKPTMGSALRATYGQATSRTVVVRVRPRVTLRYVKGVFTVRVTAARSFRGRRALFQQRGPRGWRTLRRIVLRDRPQRFSVELEAPARVRAFVPLRQAVPGYASGWSRTLLVRRIPATA